MKSGTTRVVGVGSLEYGSEILMDLVLPLRKKGEEEEEDVPRPGMACRAQGRRV